MKTDVCLTTDRGLAEGDEGGVFVSSTWLKLVAEPIG
jgi:hypothetical protein